MGWKLGQSPTCDWAWGLPPAREGGNLEHHHLPSAGSPRSVLGALENVGRTPLDLVGVGKQGVLVQPSIPCLDSLSSWTPSFFRRVLVLSVIETAA